MPRCHTDMSQYVRDISRYPLLTKEEERELYAKIKQGDSEARDRLICCNTRLVMNLCKRYLCDGMEIDDLIAEGNKGLLRAVKLFDPDKYDVRFASYATYWIKQFLFVAIKNRTLIHVPNYCIEILENSRPEHSTGRQTSCLDAARIVLAAERGRRVQGDEADGYVNSVDLLTSAPELDQIIVAETLEARHALVAKMLACLTDRERQVIHMRVWEKMTLCQIGQLLEITKERVRQIQSEAIKRLKERFASVDQTS